MDWRLQIIKKAVFSRIPFGNRLRRLKRRLWGYEPHPGNLDYTLKNLELMRAELKSLGRSFRGSRVLEIGSGWFPTIPLMLAMENVEHVYMTDLVPHMDDITFGSTLRYLNRRYAESGFFNNISCLEDVPISYLAPFEPAQVSDGSLDFIISRTVLEHIPPAEISEFFSVLRPKLKPDGLMVHVIDNSDHLEFSDKSISRIHFLTWGKRKHSFINFLMKDGENRLRHHEYPPLFERAGFRVLREKTMLHAPTRDQVGTLRLASPYSGMSPEQLAVLTSVYVLAPQTRADGKASGSPGPG